MLKRFLPKKLLLLLEMLEDYETLKKNDRYLTLCAFQRHMQHTHLKHKKELEKRVNEMQMILRSRTDVYADFSHNGPNSIIVCGRHKDTSFVQTYTLGPNCFEEMIEKLNTLQKYGHIREVDAPPSIRAVIRDYIAPGKGRRKTDF